MNKIRVLRLFLVLGIVMAFNLVVYGEAVYGWDSGTVSGECYESSNVTLTPLGIVSYNHMKQGFRYSDLYENFEWGSDGDDLEDVCDGLYEWHSTEGEGSYGEVSEFTSVSVYRSAEQYYGGSGQYCLWLNLVAVDDVELEFWWYKEDAVEFSFYWGDGVDDVINWVQMTDERIRIYDGTNFYYYDIGLLPDMWNCALIDDLDWVSGTYDLWVNGEIVVNNAPMRDWSGFADRLAFYTQEAVGSVWFDNFNVWSYVYETGSFGVGGYTMVIEGLEVGTVYYLEAVASSMAFILQQSDVFVCSTDGASVEAEFLGLPVWFVSLVIGAFLLSLYIKSIWVLVSALTLGVVGMVWVADIGLVGVGVWLGVALFGCMAGYCLIRIAKGGINV